MILHPGLAHHRYRRLAACGISAKVLPICLEEIRRCRPYFIGLLGERYGWVPDTIPPEIVEQEPWLCDLFNQSVTELDILHWVLRNSDMAQHALFYLRDSAYIETLPPEQRPDFVAEDPDSAIKLENLKDNIRRSGFPVRERYSELKVLSERVSRDLTDVIDTLFLEGSQRDPLDRDAMDHDAFAQSRARVYIGRQEYYDRLDAHPNAQTTSRWSSWASRVVVIPFLLHVTKRGEDEHADHALFHAAVGLPSHALSLSNANTFGVVPHERRFHLRGPCL